MFRLNGRKAVTLFFPLIILLIAWILAMSTYSSDNDLNVFIALSHIFALLSLVLSIWFQNSRVFYAVCVILFSVSILSSHGNLSQRAVINGISILIPTVFIILAVVEEKGITTRHGLIKGLVFILLIMFVVIDSSASNPFLEKFRIIMIKFRNMGNVQGIPIISVFLFTVCLCILLIRFLVLFRNMEMAFIGVTLGCFVILHFADFPYIIMLFSSAVFLIFVVSLFETSYSLSFHDSLTGLLSRRALEKEFIRVGNRYTLAIIDVDHFKQVNDRFGHQIGDKVLKMVAATIERNAKDGKVFRYGGEEFVVIFPKKSVNETLHTLERIRRGVENRQLVIRKVKNSSKNLKENTRATDESEKIRITVSIGVAEKNEKVRNLTNAEVIALADKAVYLAKENGRNCIVY